MIIQQSTIHGKYHRITGYLLRNVDAGTQEFAGTGNRVNEGQRRQTDKLQMMTSCWGRTSELHKQIAQSKMTSLPRMEIANDALGCSRATQVLMEYLRLVNLTEICPSRRVGHFKAPCYHSGWMKT